MGAEIAFGGRIVIGIDIESIVRTRLHASLATNAALVVKINDSVGPPVQGAGGTDFRARRVIAVVAPHHSEVTGGMGKLALLDMLDPSAKYTNRHLVLLFARDRAGVTANATILIDDESVSHLWTFTLLPHVWEKISAPTS
jgi:hypothetical protein